jgi:hypothetical protein
VDSLVCRPDWSSASSLPRRADSSDTGVSSLRMGYALPKGKDE